MLLASPAILFAALILPPERAGAGGFMAKSARPFMRWMTAAIAGQSIVTILWNGLPILLVPACG